MKAVALTGIRRVEVIDVPRPRIDSEGDVLLKVEKVGVCGSDVHYYETGRIGGQVVEYPFIVGHELTARVEEVGPAVTNVRASDNVFVEPAIACHQCDQCAAGRENTCRNLKFLGCPGQVDGCLCEYIVMPAECCFPIDGKLSLAQGVICEPLAIGLYAVKQAGVCEGTDSAILGAGPIGLSCLLAAQAANGRSFFVTEEIDARIETARKAGANWVASPESRHVVKEVLDRAEGGVDVVFECAGKQETIDEAIGMLRPGGKLMLIGIPRAERISFAIDHLRRKEISVINVRRQNRCTQACIDMIAAGRISVDFMLTHRFSPEQSNHAFDTVAHYRDGVIKALIEFP